MAEPDQTDPPVPSTLLDEVGALRTAVRREIRSESWQWMVVWSLVCVGAALTAVIPAVERLAGFYWLVGAPIGLVATAWVEQRIDRRRRVRQNAWPYWATAGGITVANLVGSFTMSNRVIVVWVWVVLACGFAVLCRLGRHQSAALGFLAAAFVIAIAGVLVEDTFALYPVIGLGLAGFTGFWALRMRAEARAR